MGKFRRVYSNVHKLACLTPDFPVSAGRLEGAMRGPETKEAYPLALYHQLYKSRFTPLSNRRSVAPESEPLSPTNVGGEAARNLPCSILVVGETMWNVPYSYCIGLGKWYILWAFVGQSGWKWNAEPRGLGVHQLMDK